MEIPGKEEEGGGAARPKMGCIVRDGVQSYTSFLPPTLPDRYKSLISFLGTPAGGRGAREELGICLLPDFIFQDSSCALGTNQGGDLFFPGAVREHRGAPGRHRGVFDEDGREAGTRASEPGPLAEGDLLRDSLLPHCSSKPRSQIANPPFNS